MHAQLSHTRLTRRHCLALLAGTGLAPATLWAQGAAPFNDALLAQAAALREAAVRDQHAYRLVDSLVTEVGARPVGSANYARAVDWALAQLKAMGFANVHAESMPAIAWRQGAVSAELIGPFPQRLVAVALGNSVGTPAGGLEAEVAYYDSLEALKADASDRAKGRIVFINQKMERHRDGHGYGTAVVTRVNGAVEASRKGALAVVIRSIGTDRDRLPHTGAMRYDPQVKPIPALAVSVPDGELVGRMQRLGRPLVMRLLLQAETGLAVTSHNVIAEVPGTDLANEVVMIGGHLDSWHVGQGAVDDGAGVAIVAAAAKQVLDFGKPLRRTLRVVMFANEENGLEGARAYAERYKGVRHQLVGESDFGAGRVWRLRSKVGAHALPALQQIAKVLAPLGVEAGDNDGHAGSDVGFGARAHNWPVVELTQDGTDYFDWHHTDNDTLDKIDPAAMSQNVAAWAVTSFLAAQSGQRFFSG